MAEKIGRSGVQISHGRLLISTLISILERPQRCNFRLMLKHSFRDGVLGCFNYGNQGWSWLLSSGAIRGVHTIRVFLKNRVQYTSNESKILEIRSSFHLIDNDNNKNTWKEDGKPSTVHILIIINSQDDPVVSYLKT
ncbi:unnamed protein product [Rotaria socialis]|uniref:Uncharacterized protein n=1 Tax=Rotaria socialis TaxID=392032 RepID=A0A821L221_9BILA|nr:unnamed protein product [Rotaria socialis]